MEKAKYQFLCGPEPLCRDSAQGFSRKVRYHVTYEIFSSNLDELLSTEGLSDSMAGLCAGSVHGA
jgi:hypothetical protein